MKLNLYLAFVVDGKGKPFAGPLLATDKVHAMSRAIEKCKAKFGKRSRVTKIQHVGEADAPLMKRTQLLQVLDRFDQVAFVAVEIEKLTRKTAELIQQLTAYVRTLQAKYGE